MTAFWVSAVSSSTSLLTFQRYLLPALSENSNFHTRRLENPISHRFVLKKTELLN